MALSRINAKDTADPKAGNRRSNNMKVIHDKDPSRNVVDSIQLALECDGELLFEADQVGYLLERLHPHDDWKYEIANGDTKQGYKEWATHREDEL
tara:strand:+ start:3862 stop:4146 length:285 start_codon:yes stop_codon:yes gene_type:complete